MTPSGQYAVKKGDLFLIRPDEAIHYRADYADPWTYYWIGFNGHEAFNIMNLCGFSDTCLVQFYGEDPILKNLFHKLAYPNYQGISREYELLGYLYEIFSECLTLPVWQSCRYLLSYDCIFLTVSWQFLKSININFYALSCRRGLCITHSLYRACFFLNHASTVQILLLY